VAELAQLMNLDEKEVIEARVASNGYRSSSLDAAIGSSEDGETALSDFIGNEDGALELVEDFHALAPMIADLDKRSRRILHWRFVEELTQDQIAERLGVSQMHVSRLLSRTLAQLRKACSPPTDTATSQRRLAAAVNPYTTPPPCARSVWSGPAQAVIHSCGRPPRHSTQKAVGDYATVADVGAGQRETGSRAGDAAANLAVAVGVLVDVRHGCG
jgi:RNA polymerase sigma factor (sigma-70 family)